jgi:hypothetical protein
MDFLQRETGQHWMQALMMLNTDYRFNLDLIQFNLKKMMYMEGSDRWDCLGTCADGKPFRNLTGVETNPFAASHPVSESQSATIRGLASHSSLSAPFRPVLDLFGKEIETERTGRLIDAYILALKLIALHKEIALEFVAERVLVLEGDFNIFRYNSAKEVCLSAF